MEDLRFRCIYSTSVLDTKQALKIFDMSMFKSGIAKDIFGNVNSKELKQKGIEKLQ